MKIGYFGGAINEGTVDDVVAEARAAEADGFDSFWVPQIFSHDALVVLGIVAREVPRIELGTSVIPTYPRHPMALAQQCHSVNAVADGRLTVGIGLSHEVVIHGMLGMDYSKPIRHIRDYLSILGPLSRGEAVRHEGEDFTLRGGVQVAGQKPFGIVVAALGPQMLKATAEMADGTLTWCTGPNTLADHTIPTITAAADEADRPTPRVIAALPVCVTDDMEGARSRAAQVFEIYGQLPSYRAMMDREGVDGPEGLAIVGSTDEVVERIGHLGEIGVTDFAAVQFPGNESEAADTRAAIKQLMG